MSIPVHQRLNIPSHTRSQPEFATRLNAAPADVIQMMDRMGDDIPEQSPEYQIALPSVGVQRTHIPVQIMDPFGSQQPTPILCELSLTSYIPAHKRGIHMSRIGNLLADATGTVYEDLQQYASYLAAALKDCQYGGRSEVHVSGTFSYLEAVRGWKPEKDKQSLESIRLSAGAVADDDGVRQSMGLSVAHITACPCVQQTYKHTLLQSGGAVDEAIKLTEPLFTHSQRCEASVRIENLSSSFPVKRLLDALDQVLFRTQNTLPREYELLLVYRAHKEPQFIEDAMRQVVFTLNSLLADDEYSDCAIDVRSTSMESIHDFDIHATYRMTVRELRERYRKRSVPSSNGMNNGMNHKGNGVSHTKLA